MKLLKELNKFKNNNKKIQENMNVIMPGLPFAKCTTNLIFTLFNVFFEMINRDKIRSLQLIESLNECPLGQVLSRNQFF